MITGVSISTFTYIHVTISLVGLVAGVLHLVGAIDRRHVAGLTTLFLLATAAASLSGFGFPSTRFGLGHAIGALSLVVLIPTTIALYVFRLAGIWGWVYVTGATVTLYLNAFIAVSQAFRKMDVLNDLESMASMPLQLTTHFAVLAFIVVLGLLVIRRLRQERRPTTRLEAPFPLDRPPIAWG